MLKLNFIVQWVMLSFMGHVIFFQFFSTIKKWRDFPGDPVAKTLRTQCRGPSFDPWSGNQIPHATSKSSYAATKTQHSKMSKKICNYLKKKIYIYIYIERERERTFFVCWPYKDMWLPVGNSLLTFILELYMKEKSPQKP